MGKNIWMTQFLSDLNEIRSCGTCRIRTTMCAHTRDFILVSQLTVYRHYLKNIKALDMHTHCDKTLLLIFILFYFFHSRVADHSGCKAFIVFIRVTVWGKKLSQWRLVLASSAPKWKVVLLESQQEVSSLLGLKSYSSKSSTTILTK